MKNFNVSFPYPIGTYLTTVESGQIHIDQLHEYTVDRNGIHAILLLEVFNDPRLSRKIDIDYLVTNWKVYEKQDNKNCKKVKSIKER